MILQAKIHKTYENHEKNIKAFASVTFDNLYVVNSVILKDGDKGLHIAMPRIKYGEEYKDTFHPITKGAYKEMFECVLKAYEQKLSEQEQSG